MFLGPARVLEPQPPESPRPPRLRGDLLASCSGLARRAGRAGTGVRCGGIRFRRGGLARCRWCRGRGVEFGLGRVFEEALDAFQFAQHRARFQGVLAAALLDRLELAARGEDQLRCLKQLLPGGGEGELAAESRELLVLLGGQSG